IHLILSAVTSKVCCNLLRRPGSTPNAAYRLVRCVVGDNPEGTEIRKPFRLSLSTRHSALSTRHSALGTQHSALGTRHSALGTQPVCRSPNEQRRSRHAICHPHPDSREGPYPRRARFTGSGHRSQLSDLQRRQRNPAEPPALL